MTISQKLLRLGLATALIGSLGACAVAPYPAGYHRAQQGYVETYPAYGQPSGTIYYNSGYRQYDNRGDHYYDNHRGGRHYADHRYDNRRYEEPRRQSMPLPPPLQLHRDIRRSLGLPRLPGVRDVTSVRGS